MRAAIAEAMSRSKREIPHYYLSTTVDVTPAVTWLASHNAPCRSRQRLLFAALLGEVRGAGLPRTRGVQRFIARDVTRQARAVHVGVASPCAAAASSRLRSWTRPTGRWRSHGGLRAVVTRARAGRLRASELAAPTIILTSLGDSAVDAVFPIIQPPQVAIVGAGAVAERLVVRFGRAATGPDPCARGRPCVTDGRLGAQFLAGIAAKLVDPASL